MLRYRMRRWKEQARRDKLIFSLYVKHNNYLFTTSYDYFISLEHFIEYKEFVIPRWKYMQ